MASNKTKLAKSSGKSAFDFDDDFDNFFEDPSAKSSKSPIQQFMSGLKNTLLDPGKNKSLLKAFVTSGIPDGYVSALGTYDQVKKGAGALKDHLETTNPADLQYLFGKADKMLASYKGKMNEGLYEKINSALSDKVSKYNYQIEANRSPTMLGIRQQKEDDANEIKAGLGEDLRGSIDQSTMVNRSLFNQGEQATQKRWDLDRIERGLRDQIQVGQTRIMSRGIAEMNTGIDRLVSYNEQVDYDFQRKNLELAFRSTQTLRDIAKMTASSLEMNNKAFQALVRNTGLPDHLKSSMKDLVSMNMRQGAAQGVLAFGGKTLSSFLGGYGNQVQNNVNGKASSTLGGIVQGMRAGENMGSMWDQRYNLAGSMAAEGLQSFGRSTVAPLAGRLARPHVDRLNSKYGKGKDKQLGYMADNAPAMLQDFVNNYQNSTGAKGVLQDMLRPFVPQFGLQTNTSAGSYQTLGTQTGFNELSQRALTEILPGFQARILRELRMIRTGDADTPMEVFDITKGTFTDKKSAMSNLESRIVSKSTARLVSGTLNESLDKMDPEAKLSPGARAALSERLLRDSASNKHMDPMRYGSKFGYKAGTDKETLNELETFFKEQFERDDEGKFANTEANHTKRKEFSDAFLNVRNVSRDPGAEIQRLLQAGDTSGLRELGIVINEDGVDKINYPRLWELMSTGVTERSGEAGKRYNDYTGDKNDRNFVGPQHPGQPAVIIENALNSAGKAAGSLATSAADKVRALADAAGSAKDAAQAGGLQGLMDKFSVQEKIDLAQAMMENAIANEPPEMREQRLKMAATILQSIETAKATTAALSTSVKDGAQGAIDQASGYIDQAKQSESAGVLDLKLQEGGDVVIRAVDMLAGKLTDVNTGKVVKSAADITGEVRNNLGQIVLSATEAAQGLFDKRGTLIAKGKAKLDAVQAAIAKVTGKAKELSDDMKDWCLAKSGEVIIKSRQLLNGEYLDAESGEPIYSLDDIKGTIIDTQGRVVATAAELAEGLVSYNGDKYTVDGAKEKAMSMATQAWRGNTTSNIFAAMKLFGKGAYTLGRNTMARLFGDRDAYLPGEVTPILTVEKLKDGEYLDEKGKPITSMGDISGPVFDKEGTAILDAKQLKSLVDVNGKPHKIAKNRGLMRRAFNSTVGAAAKGYWNLTKKYYGALGKELGNDGKAALNTFVAPVGAFTKRQLKNLSTTDQVLVQIRDSLRDGLPKKQRKGSWMDLDEKDKAKKDEASKGKEDVAPKSAFGKMAAMFSGLMGKMFGKKNEEEPEEEGSLLDTANDALDTANGAKDLLGGGGEGGGSRRGGRLKRWGRKIAGSKIGRMVGSTVGKVMGSRVGMMAASALATLVSAPVLIGGAAVVAVGVGAYFGYQYIASTKGEFGSIRMLQYGITSIRQRRKMLALEELMQKTAVKGPDPQMNLNAENGKKIIDIMGFDPKDEQQFIRFARWMDQRFKPVFLTWLKALDTVGRIDLPLREIDDKLLDEMKGTFVREITMPYGPGSVFTVLDDPDGSDDPLPDTTEETQKRIAELTEKYPADPAKKVEGEPLPGVPPKPAETDKAKAALATGAIAAAGVTAGTAALSRGKEENEKKDTAHVALDKVINAAPVVAVAAAAVGTVAAVVQPTTITSNTLEALDAIRARAYGMEALDKEAMASLIALETRVDMQSKVSQTNEVKFTGDATKFIAGSGGLFGLNTAEEGPDRTKFVNWFYQRFLPVCETFLTNARATYRGKPGAASTAIALPEQVRIGNAIIGAQNPTGGSIWAEDSIFPIKGKLSELKDLAQADLDHLKEKANTVIASPTMTAGAQAAGAASAAAGKGFLAGAADAVTSAFNSVTDVVKDGAGYVGRAAEATYNTAKDVGSAIGTRVSNAVGAVTSVFKGGESYGQVTKGNGGQWEQVPYPTAKTPVGSMKSLQAVAQMTGVPVQYLMLFCALESNFDWDAKAGTSSATGWFQFINSTWDWMMQLNASKYGCPPETPQRSLRLDPRINALMGAEYLKYSMGIIRKAIGREATDVELYLAHFLGPGTAAKWLQLPQNTIGATAFPKQANANKSVFYGGKPLRARTLAEIMQSFEARMAKFRAIANVGAGESVTVAKPVDPAKAEEEGAAAKSEAEGKELAKTNIPGITPMSGGPSATGSTPTNAGAPGTTSLASQGQPAAPSMLASTPIPASGGGAQTDAGAIPPSATPSAADNMATAQDNKRASQVQNSVQMDNSLMAVSQKQLDTQMEIRDLVKSLVGSGGAAAANNNNSIAPTQRSANNAKFPVSM